jgi:hypothetical protein
MDITGYQMEDSKISGKKKLILVKLIHSIIWMFFNLVIFYLYYAAITNKIGKWVWICIGLVLSEGLVLLYFGRTCPITLIARKYSDSAKDNFDIYLPNWLAKNNKLIYTVLFAAVLLLITYRLFKLKA